MTLSTRLRTAADKMQAKIDGKRSTFADSNYTARRARMQASAHRDADRMEAVQYALRGLADAHDNGGPPPLLARVKTKIAISAMLLYSKWMDWDDFEKRMRKAGLTPETYTEAREALLALAAPPDRSGEREQRELENEARRLVGQIPGFFPTPDPVIDQMLDLVNLTATDRVLEPSAGAGHIARRAKALGCRLVVCEANWTLRKLLKGQGLKLTKVSDFLTLEMFSKFSAVLMNPPFERGQDIEHVVHAFRHLRPGGRLVSVVGAGVRFRNDNKHSGFRHWLDSEGGYFIDLPDKSFASSGTGVNACLVYVGRRS